MGGGVNNTRIYTVYLLHAMLKDEFALLLACYHYCYYLFIFIVQSIRKIAAPSNAHPHNHSTSGF